MTFDERYPDAEIWFQPGDPGNEVMKGPGPPVPCWQCKALTRFIELNFEAPVCSPECNALGWREYFEACRKAALQS